MLTLKLPSNLLEIPNEGYTTLTTQSILIRRSTLGQEYCKQ